MLRRMKRWWSDNASLLFAKGLLGVLYPFLRLKEAMAPPEKQARMREMRLKMEAMQKQARDITRQIDTVYQDSPQDASLKMLSLMEKFKADNGIDTNNDPIRKMKEELIAHKNERIALDALRENAGEDTAKLIVDLRAFIVEYPQSELAEASLIGALRQSKKYDEAIVLARARFLHRNGKDGADSKTLSAATTLASLLTEKGEAHEAVLLLEKLLAEHPEAEPISRVIVYVMLAEAYEKVNNIEEARRNWKRVASHGEYKEMAKTAKERLRKLS